jgi:alpha-1,2-mannosyltransferase
MTSKFKAVCHAFSSFKDSKMIILLSLVFTATLAILYARSRKSTSIAFFHPHLHNGGGGERVLWTAIHALVSQSPPSPVTIYAAHTSDSKADTLARIKTQFNIILPEPDRLTLVYIYSWPLLDPKMYPRFTLFGQAFGSMIVAGECLVRFKPSLFIGMLRLS